jgi:hypothetical protein
LERETNKRFSPNLAEDFTDNPNTKSGIEFSLRKSLVEGIFGIKILQNNVQNKNQPFSASVKDFQQKTAILATQMHRWLTFWWCGCSYRGWGALGDRCNCGCVCGCWDGSAAARLLTN